MDYEAMLCHREAVDAMVLEGAKIFLTFGNGAGWGFFADKGTTRYKVFVQCDPEGNGPGHLEITSECKLKRKSKKP
jgi:hypothetical protein